MSDTESNKEYNNIHDYGNDYEYGNEYANDSENESQFDYQKYIDQKYNENLLKVQISETLINYAVDVSVPLCEYLDPYIIDAFLSEI
jgi:hypothetical protein